VTGPLGEAWEREADAWTAWARAPGHDAFWHLTLPALLALLPAPGSCTLDLGCGEGRLARALTARGHRVVGVDSSPTLIALAAHDDAPTTGVRADLAALPLGGDTADLAVASMSLHDVDDLDGALREVARVLRPGARLVLAIVHPVNSAGRFAEATADAPFVITGSYLDSFRYSDRAERDGLTMTFHSMHRPLERYSRALEGAGFLIEALREPRWSTAWKFREGFDRIPLLLIVVAVRPDVRPARA
jgi:SAM-dependent methyltransferase